MSDNALTVTRGEMEHGGAWITVSGPMASYSRATYAAAAEARKIGKELGGARALRITTGSSWNRPEGMFEYRARYHFADGCK